MNWRKLFKRRASPEQDLKRFTDDLQMTLGDHLKCLAIFGSMASGEHRGEYSDINLLVVLDKPSTDELHRLTPIVSRWSSGGHLPPIIVGVSEVPMMVRTHPIEWLDIRDHHRILAGTDVLQFPEPERARIVFQLDHDLSLMTLKLRQAIALYGKDRGALRRSLIDAVPSFLTLLRATLRLEEPIPQLSKIEAAERLAAKTGLNAQTLRALHDFHFSRASDHVDELTTQWLDMIEKIRHHIDGGK